MSFLRRLWADPSGRIGVVLVLAVLLLALAGPFVWTTPPNRLAVLQRFQGPSWLHPMGTDQLGRDLFARVIDGAQVALGVALTSIGLALVTGTALGVVAGLAGGRVASPILVAFDIVYSFPSLVLALAVIALLGPGLWKVVLIVAVTLSPQFGRVARAQVLGIKSSPFLEAERVLGAGPLRIVLVHILPNIVGPLVVLASMEIPSVITIEAGLSFLGAGVPPPRASWGTLLNDGYSYISQSSWPVVFAGGMLSLATLGFTLFGEAARDAADPKLHREPATAAPRIAAHGGGPAEDALLDVRDLDLDFATERGPVHVLRGVSIAVARHRIMGVIGESGSGKSTLGLAIMRLLAPNLSRLQGSIRLGPDDLLSLPERAMREVRGKRVAMIFQDPMNALNPVFTVGTQLIDFLRAKNPGLSRRAARARAAEMLARVGIADPARRLRDYPHQFSGGMRQRIVIAMALLAEAELVIADEPTTALDATVEAQIIELFERIRADLHGAMLFISHSLGLVTALCDDVTVMYAGTVVEVAPAATLSQAARHPYTRALLACELDDDGQGRALSIPGELPDLRRPPLGCPFHGRCMIGDADCTRAPPPLVELGADHRAACFKL